MFKNESVILREFFVNDLNKLIEKYNRIPKEVLEKLEELVNNLDNKVIKLILMEDLDVIIDLINELDNEFNSNIIQLYFFIRNNIFEINILEAKAIYEEIEYMGYSQIGDIIMYSSLKDLSGYVSDKIDEILTSKYGIDRLFTKENIIDYFLKGTTIEEIERELINNYNGYEKLLGIESILMFKLKDGKEYYYAYIND